METILMLMDALPPILAYLIGSINASIVLSYLAKLPDPRQHGSNNPGSTNVLRIAGKGFAALALLMDSSKGWLVTFYLLHHDTSTMVTALSILTVFLGHLFPIYHRLRGGKGVATSLGIIVALSPHLALIALALWALIVISTRWVSLASMMAALFAAIAGCYLLPTSQAFALSAIAVLLIIKHHQNITRLINGSEHKI